VSRDAGRGARGTREAHHGCQGPFCADVSRPEKAPIKVSELTEASIQILFHVPSDRQIVELFHFVFLERLVRQTSASLYVLKGGVNLRFFEQSPRYSEDMDLDVHHDRVGVQTLKKNGYKILADAAFRRVLMTAGIAAVEVNDPKKAKHTDVTQRFRATLVLESGQRLATKVEFSRRGIDETQTKIERVSPEVSRRHGRTAYDVQHYAPAAAARQKIEALAGRPQTQARDLFDFALLDARGAVDDALLDSVGAKLRDRAATAVSSLTYADWQGQVLEYLEEDALDEYDGEHRFESLQLHALERLERGR
jgi:predicted nucleotidyltransferase component of viral defense system